MRKQEEFEKRLRALTGASEKTRKRIAKLLEKREMITKTLERIFSNIEESQSKKE